MKIIYIIILTTNIIACQSTIPVQTAQSQLNINLFNNKHESDNRKYINQIRNEIKELDLKISNTNINENLLTNYINLKEKVETLDKTDNSKDIIVLIESLIISIFTLLKIFKKQKKQKEV